MASIEEIPRFKYVKVTYTLEHRSVWKVPVEWDNAKIGVKWDELSYEELSKEEINKKIIRKMKMKEINGGEFCKWPDGDTTTEGCQDNVFIGNLEEMEDECGYDTCESGEDTTCESSEDESDSEEE